MKKAREAHGARRVGRPLSFERETALHQAMLLFWRQGYEGTSINDLTAAMGVTPPSIYAVFGNKKGLFLAAVQRYLGIPSTPDEILARAETAREAAWELLRTAATTFTNPATPRGCLLASSAVACSDDSSDVREALSQIRLRIEAALRKRILRGIRAGELDASTDASTLAGLIIAVIQGMSTLARDGASRAKLVKLAEMAMTAWPAA